MPQAGWTSVEEPSTGWTPVAETPVPVTPKATSKSGWEKYAHAAGIPAHVSEINDMIKGILLPEASPTDPGFGQTIPVVGPAFRAARETYNKPGAAAKVYGSIPFVGPPGYAAGKALQDKDWLSAAGSLTNILAQLFGAKKGGAAPGSVESVMESATGKPQVQVPSKAPETTIKPGTGVLGAPQGMIGQTLAKRFGLRPDYAVKVARQVEEIRKTRESAQNATTSVSRGAEKDISQVGESAKATSGIIDQTRDRAISSLERQIGDLEDKRVSTGTQLMADTTEAAYQELQKVRQPFKDIGDKIQGSVASNEGIKAIVEDAVKSKGARVEEIPSTAFRAMKPTLDMSPGEAMARKYGYTDETDAINKVGKGVWDSVLSKEKVAPEPNNVAFNDLTRIREDLFNAAVSTKDGAVRSGLYDAAEQITDMQEKIASENGMGPQYKIAKQNYKEFRRGIGSSMVEKWLSAKDVKEQAVIPKLTKLTTPASAQAMRVVLKSVGIDVATYDAIVSQIEKTKETMKGVPKEAAGAQKALASSTKARVGEIESSAGEQIKAIQKAASEKEGRSQELGSQVLKGKTTEDLAGLSNEEINRKRFEELADSAKSKGITNPYNLFHIVYGLARMSPYHLIRGGMSSGESLLRNAKFQDWVLMKSGVKPGTPASFTVKQALGELSRTLPSSAKQVQSEQ